MKTLFSWIVGVIAMMALCVVPLNAEGRNNGNFSVTLGYQGLDVGKDTSTLHDTHPNDRGILANGNLPGSAGETEIDFANIFNLGLRYDLGITDNFSFGLEVGGTLCDERDEKQNANDPRLAANGAFVYSKATGGFYVSAGVEYHFKGLKGLYLGLDAQVQSLGVEHGYYRWGSDEKVKSETVWIPTAMPKIGYTFEDLPLSLEAFASIGSSVGGGVKLVYRF